MTQETHGCQTGAGKAPVTGASHVAKNETLLGNCRMPADRRQNDARPCFELKTCRALRATPILLNGFLRAFVHKERRPTSKTTYLSSPWPTSVQLNETLGGGSN